ncbi:acyl-CoA dehydrogenase family protein [Alkalihalobacterium alkalinitrilicum]|uniref:acyl-CoA dehydrogenase family protein n=1 Tax=Alkalihalobacterium alkalinitrilicum TaxID=427920 RepID=UPI0009958DD8|nr:acyl-CoA dehydrogenase family protein [Alkalihalobacterium alkalinitrilicum]
MLEQDRIIGEVGEGDRLLQSWITESQVLLASRCLGIAKFALNQAIDYGQMRITRGQPLTRFPAVRTMIATSITEIEAGSLLVKESAKHVTNNHENGPYFAKMAKRYATDVAFKIIDDVLQLHGGAGYTKDLPFERLYKELRFARLEFLNSEVINNDLAERYIEKML